MERAVQHPLGPAVPSDPLTAALPGAAARDAARFGLYVHVPFCAVRCTYCDFATGPLSRARLERWLDALEREIALRSPSAAGRPFRSVFFGGGSPSVLASRHFRRVWAAITAAFAIAPDAEITLEANPESVAPSLLATWRACGVNRLSMGVQSFDPGELARLGRVHSQHRPAQAFAAARAAGFEHLSLDLMFGYPGHTADTFARTLDAVAALAPGHVSAYCFIPEPGTPLGDDALAGRAPLPPPEAQAELYAQLERGLAAEGLAPYETSNFARPGCEARHNLTYWLRREYVALGPSAHGFVAGERYANHDATADWAAALESGASPEVSRERPDPDAAADETVLLALRLAGGLDLRDVEAGARGALLARYADALRAGEAQARLVRTPHGWRLPEAHRFVADDTIAWLAARARPSAGCEARAGLTPARRAS